MRTIRFWVSMIVLVAAGPGVAQTPQQTTTTISSADLLEEVRILRRSLESLHPGMYRYTLKDQADRNSADLETAFAKDHTVGEAFLAYSRFLATIRCGHTYTNFYNQPKSVAAALFGGRNRVPFLFRWIGGKMIVTRGVGDGAPLPAGTEVVAINGVAASDILAAMLPLARADGGNDAKRVAYLEVGGRDTYEAFDIYLPLLFPSFGETFTLLVRKPGGGEVSECVARAMTGEERLALTREREADRGDQPAWKFEIIGDGVALLRMKSWVMYKGTWDWRSFLNQGMDELIDKGISYLIVDLRGNEGGNDVGDVILSRIATAEVRTDRLARFTRYRAAPQELLKYLDTWDPSFKDWGESAQPDQAGYYRLADDDGGVIKPSGRRYAGRLIVLIDASNSSATGQFAEHVKQNKLGVLVGQATGGNRRGINGGAFFFLRLPHSKIEVDLPLIARFPVGEKFPSGDAIPFRDVPDAGVEPDIAVTPTVEDISRHRDAEMAAALELCGTRR